MVDPSGFPTGAPVSLAYEHTGFHAHWSGEPLHEISAVWQVVSVGSALPAMEPGVRETCILASERAIVGTLDNLDAFQLDPHAAQMRADNKPRQLRLAQLAGLEIPATLITNDAAAVRAFAARHGGAVIAKMLEQVDGSFADDDASVVFTTALDADQLAELDGLDLCPMIFQERVMNQRDVRVFVVGKQLFAAALDASARAGDLDWRRESYALDRVPVWQPCELPRALADRLIAVVDRMGLNYAAIDLVMTPDERYVFLELNACGAFAFLGDALAEPIAGALADTLIDPAARREVRHV